jgi:hypothetical protein
MPVTEGTHSMNSTVSVKTKAARPNRSAFTPGRVGDFAEDVKRSP